ncbi:unnamed protein product [Schistocephalus solidus]|uniref:Reverse transcriptase domain-containing protein n=1 Tax=Schistocephalus solidus TaxID=70667 RepID=A0A183SRH5_SCHSO|nr:unnamed protein product [Schistocephalus solidus]
MLRNRVKGLIGRTRQDFEVDLLNRVTVNPRLFNDYLRQNTRNKDPIPLLRTTERIDHTEDGAKDEHLSEFFRDKQLAKVEVESGVPQGSVLGPILFIVYINDCANEMDCDIAMFANYLKLWRVIQKAADKENLQANLNQLQKWSNDWLLPFNESKCNIIRVRNSNPLNRTVYRLNGIPFKKVGAQKDLGFWTMPSFKPSLHCAKVAKSPMSIPYLVKRAFSAFTTDCFAKVFGTFVWPQLESAVKA